MVVWRRSSDGVLRFITGTELANGFFNRFIVIAVKRCKELPFGGRLAGEDLDRVRTTLTAALQHSQHARQLSFDPAARERWIAVYGPLSRGEQGLLGAAISRAEAHVIRLAAIYATLDRDSEIRLPHPEAALALWHYSADSARWIFGDSLGDPTADEIWAAAKERPAGLTRTEVSDMFSRFVARHKTQVLFPNQLCGRRRRGPTMTGANGPVAAFSGT